jgi:hypothetical protein
MEKTLSKSKVYCCVPQCKSTYSVNVSFHHFPTYNDKLRSEWIRVLKIGKPVTLAMRVCGRHFKDSDFFLKEHVNKAHKLKKNVVPSLCLPIGSHDKRINETQKEQRASRLPKRKRELESALQQQITFDGNNGNDRNDPLLECDDGEGSPLSTRLAAEALVLLSENVIQQNCHKKTYEDKAIQVNTYEEFKEFDVSNIIDNNYKLKVLTGIQNMDLLSVMTSALTKLDKTRNTWIIVYNS